MSIPSPADAPTMSASELLKFIRERGGRIYRYVEPPKTFVLTDDPELVAWLAQRRAHMFVPPAAGGGPTAPDGSYLRDSVTGKREWDLQINAMPVTDDLEADIVAPGLAIWTAAA